MTNLEPYTPKVVLAVGAHPDDIDFGASGSVAKWAQEGAEVYYLILTDGGKGSPDPNITTPQLIETRRQEQRDALAVLGGKEVHFFDFPDGELEVTMELKKQIVRLIRQVKPDTVVVMDPSAIYNIDMGFINHPDHRAAGQATLDAIFPLARDHLSFPDLFTTEQLEPHKVAHVLLTNFEKQNFYVDITSTIDLKLDALKRHVSQIPDVPTMEERLRARAAEMGRHTGSQYAEGFVRLDPPQ